VQILELRRWKALHSAATALFFYFHHLMSEVTQVPLPKVYHMFDLG